LNEKLKVVCLKKIISQGLVFLGFLLVALAVFQVNQLLITQKSMEVAVNSVFSSSALSQFTADATVALQTAKSEYTQVIQQVTDQIAQLAVIDFMLGLICIGGGLMLHPRD
jgi:H+/gluconate symporter-like permease